MIDFIEEVVKIANRSTHRKHMMGCIIVQNGEIVSNGWSHEGTWRMRELYWMHAEHHALFRARHLDLTDATIYIAAIARKSGNYAIAKPCINCAIALRAAGIDKVAYSVGTSFHTMLLSVDLNSLKKYPSPYES